MNHVGKSDQSLAQIVSEEGVWGDSLACGFLVAWL